MNKNDGSVSTIARSTALLPFLVGASLLHVSCAGSTSPPIPTPPNPNVPPATVPPAVASVGVPTTTGGTQAPSRATKGQASTSAVANTKLTGAASGGDLAESKPSRGERSAGSVPWQQSMAAPPSQTPPPTKVATADPKVPPTTKPPTVAAAPRMAVSKPVVNPEEIKTQVPTVYETTKTIDRTESYTPKISGD